MYIKCFGQQIFFQIELMNQSQDPGMRICSCLSIITIVVFLTLIFIGVSTIEDIHTQVDKIKSSSYLKCSEICENPYQQQINSQCCDFDFPGNCLSKLRCISQKLINLSDEQDTTLTLIWIYSAIQVVVIIAFICCMCKICKKRQENYRNPIYNFHQNINPIQERQNLLDRRININYQSFLHSDVDNYCSICIQQFQHEKAIRLRCGHIFHSACIREWANKKENCPICRSNQ